MKKLILLMERMRLNTKLILGIGSGFLVTLIVGGISIYAMHTMNRDMQVNYNLHIQGLNHFHDAQVNLLKIANNLKAMALSETMNQRNEAKQDLMLARSGVVSEMREGRQLIITSEMEGMIKDFDRIFIDYCSTIDTVIKNIEQENSQGRLQASYFMIGDEYKMIYGAAEMALENITIGKQKAVYESARHSEELSEYTQQLSIGLLIFGLLGSLSFGYLISQSIKKPLAELKDNIEELAAGNLDVEVPHADFNNEIGVIAKAVSVLKTGAKANELQQWIKQRLTDTEKEIQSAASYKEFADKFSSSFAESMNLIYAAFYVPDSSGSMMIREGGYGCDENSPGVFEIGHGLVGQAALDKKAIDVELKEDRIGVSLGLGVIVVRSLIIVPVCDADRVFAVLELGSLEPFKERDRMLIDAAVPMVATKMQILSGNIATLELLGKTTAQAEALAASEHQLLARKDELEAINDTLASQAKTLEEQALALEIGRKELEQSEAYTRLILSSVNEGIWGLDTGGRTTMVNKAAGEMLGYTIDELMGKNMHELVHHSHPDGSEYDIHCCHMYATSQDGVARTIDDEVLWRKDGSSVPVEYDTTPIYKDGKIVGTVIVFRDITERKKAEAEIKLVNFMSDQALDLAQAGYWHIDGRAGDGYYTSSERAAALYGHAFKEGWRYSIMDDWYPNVEAADMRTAVEVLKTLDDFMQGKTPKFDVTFPFKRPDNGKIVWLRNIGHKVTDENGRTSGIYGVTMDITVNKLAEDTIRQAKEAAEDATRMKSDFLANMSHEIRTPMNAIIGMSHLALQTELNTKQRNYIEKVDSAARNLLGIINDILDFSKIEAGKMKFEKVDFYLEDVLEHLADLSVIKAQEKGLEVLFDVATDVPTALVGDPLRLGQVLINLANNAIKFTEKGEIKVAVRSIATENSGVRLRFEIIDTGIGLTEEQRNRLFKAFSQADASTTRKYGGTGLGLTICKHLVEMMHGEIDVASEPGKGSTFFFDAVFGLQNEQRRLNISSEDVRGVRILVVDDNASAREILSNILISLKFDATAVSSGAQAIGELEQAQIEHRPYSLVFMDWMMPGMDGLETIKKIRQNNQLSETPAFIMVTAYSRDELMTQAEKIKIDGVLVKPVSPSTMLDSILNALGKEVTQKTRKHEKQANYQEAAKKVCGARILLVEDNPINQELAIELLQDAGIIVDVAVNGAEAVDKVNTHSYDGVLMDCQMPVMDGFEATRRIREDGRYGKLPILAMTANAMAGDKEKCVASGMNDHIAKPIDVAQLFITLAEWITPSSDTLPEEMVCRTTASNSAVVIAGLDMKGALERVGGNAELFNKLLGRFAETQKDVLDRITAAADTGDFETAVREAHTLKGLAGNIGASSLYSVAAEAEAGLKKGTSYGLEEVFNNLKTELFELVTVISDAMPKKKTETATGTTEKITEDELSELSALLDDMDSEAADSAAGIADKLKSSGHGELAVKLIKHIDNFDFDAAAEVLSDIRNTLKPCDTSGDGR